jgi:hypothetical protein
VHGQERVLQQTSTSGNFRASDKQKLSVTLAIPMAARRTVPANAIAFDHPLTLDLRLLPRHGASNVGILATIGPTEQAQLSADSLSVP